MPFLHCMSSFEVTPYNSLKDMATKHQVRLFLTYCLTFFFLMN